MKRTISMGNFSDLRDVFVGACKDVKKGDYKNVTQLVDNSIHGKAGITM